MKVVTDFFMLAVLSWLSTCSLIHVNAIKSMIIFLMMAKGILAEVTTLHRTPFQSPAGLFPSSWLEEEGRTTVDAPYEQNGAE
jgi:hypothetical protein